MSIYRQIDQLRSNELTVLRSGFWMPDYLLSDGQFNYGRLSRDSLSVSQRTIEIADNTFTLRRAGIFSRETLILKNGEVIGKTTRNIWRYTNNIELNNGFKTSFVRTPGAGLFTSKMSWMAGDKELINISGRFSFSRPMVVSITDPTIIKQADNLLLMAFIGINLRLLRQARAAAA
ncbi:hypothetical protein [Mucilaginibacter sp. HD30]